jgi:hypothetical protein
MAQLRLAISFPIERLSQNLMSQRRHYFGPASRSDDKSYSQGYGESGGEAYREERRRGRPKRVSPSVARKRPVCGVVGPQRIPTNTLRPSALHPSLFLAIAGSLGLEIVSYCSPAPPFTCLAPRGGRGGVMGHSGTKWDIFRRKRGKIGPVLRLCVSLRGHGQFTAIWAI